MAPGSVSDVRASAAARPRRFAGIARRLSVLFGPPLLVGLITCGFLSWRYGSLDNAIHAILGETLLVDSRENSVGPMHQGDEVTTEFRVTNLMSTPARILGAQTSCTCTVPDEMPFTIPAYSSRAFRVRVHAPGSTGLNDGESGPFRTELTLFTNDAKRSRVALAIRGELRPGANHTTAR